MDQELSVLQALFTVTPFRPNSVTIMFWQNNNIRQGNAMQCKVVGFNGIQSNTMESYSIQQNATSNTKHIH